MIKILIVDDHVMFRDGLNTLLKTDPLFNVIGSVSDGLEAVEFIRANQDTDIVTMDLNMPNLDGYEATRRITSEFPNVKVVIVSMFANDTAIRKSFHAGAMGFLTKESTWSNLEEAVKTVFNGEKYLSPIVSNVLLDKIINQTEKKVGDQEVSDEEEQLTKREVEIIKLICQEKSSSEIATELSVTVRTVEVHRHNIIKKIKVVSSVGIVMYAIRNGIHKIESKSPKILSESEGSLK